MAFAKAWKARMCAFVESQSFSAGCPLAPSAVRRMAASCSLLLDNPVLLPVHTPCRIISTHEEEISLEIDLTCLAFIWSIAMSDRLDVVVDLRNIYSPEDMAKRGFTYTSVGRPV